MADRILEGLWDCKYCGTDKIGGLTKHCPCCGHPQDTDIEFYLGEEKKYLEDDIAKEYGQGADWVCPYCGALNRTHYKFCATCGSAKDEGNKDYFQAQQAKQEQAAQRQAANQPAQPKKKGGKGLLILIALAAILFFIFMPRSADTQVTAKSWSRSVDVQVEKTVQESDWEVPAGGRLVSQQQEIHHYDSVIDHYETRTRQVAERVYDGQDEHVEHINNGDGTFTEHVYYTDRYRTEYHDETYEAPVYVQVPRYATKYTYDIERWVYDRTLKEEGTDDEPKWPELTLGDKERKGDTAERYTVVLTDKKGTSYTCQIALSLWEQLKVGESVKITTVAGGVSKINDIPVR